MFRFSNLSEKALASLGAMAISAIFFAVAIIPATPGMGVQGLVA